MTNCELFIRTYEACDEASVTALWCDVFRDDPPWNDPKSVILRKLATQPDLFLVGELEGTVVATVVAGFDGFRGWIYHLAVAPEHRRKGFGRVLMFEAEIRLRHLGCTKVNLQARVTNAEVIEFYRHLGYQIEETRQLRQASRITDRLTRGWSGPAVRRSAFCGRRWGAGRSTARR